ncbi:MAG: threonine--tRNA ligase [Proteobacteria bacterium]|nr:threonine--tRNA ligase [Pseudomonadota bacterium]
MPKITLPDGSVREFAGESVTGMEIAASIGAGLAKAAVAIEVDGKAQDLSMPISHDASIKIATAKDALGLDTLRHTMTAQVLTRAVFDLFPNTQLAIGPTVDNGFYHDVLAPKAISADDLPKIEARMREILAEPNTVVREHWEPAKVEAYFESVGQPFKVELVRDAVARGELVEGKYLSVYIQRGADGSQKYLDLCRGPHVPTFEKLRGLAFTISSLAGAYWRGDSANQQLTRLYGLGFANAKELEAYQHMRAEAEKRDHRKIGPALGLFHLQEEAPGQVFWHPAGWTIYTELTDYLRRKLDAAGYVEVNTPQRVNKVLYQKSGHWDNYRDNAFIVSDDLARPVVNPEEHADKQHVTLGALSKQMDMLDLHMLKPMNCPCHVQIFNQGVRSYRDLPLRMAEFGRCMRNEAKGALHGIMRVTSFTQDDAHIFCTTEQIQPESKLFCDLLKSVYADLGFSDYFVKLSTRPDKRIGDDALWDKAENALADACRNAGLEFQLNPGEGAFYGPKLEFVLRDCIGRDWQCGTLQVDFNMPVRLAAHYTTAEGTREPCVMLHRAILGSLERFIGILIENSEGKFPTWLAPVQALVIPIADGQVAYANEVAAQLRGSGIATATGGVRVEVDASNERMQKKILFGQQRKIPYMLVVGKKEAEEGTVAVRLRDGTDLGAKPLSWLLERVRGEVIGRKDS